MNANVTCPMCGEHFTEEASRLTCTHCSLLGGGCRKLRCPRCGYEMPQPARLPRLLSRLAGKLKEARKGKE
ncbi:MAG: hypothetical protein ACYC7E_08960 [Armatimonadota bacterium]